MSNKSCAWVVKQWMNNTNLKQRCQPAAPYLIWSEMSYVYKKFQVPFALQP